MATAETPRADVWIVIPGWDEFQHPDVLRSATPSWIKTWTRLLSSDDYATLTFHRRGVLHGCWLEYARSHRTLRGDTKTLTRRLGQRVTKADIDSLVAHGFIQLVASKPTAADASNLARLEREEKKEVRAVASNGASKNGEKWNGAADLGTLDYSFPGGPVSAPACPECGVGGGRHTADCVLAVLG